MYHRAWRDQLRPSAARPARKRNAAPRLLGIEDIITGALSGWPTMYPSQASTYRCSPAISTSRCAHLLALPQEQRCSTPMAERAPGSTHFNTPMRGRAPPGRDALRNHFRKMRAVFQDPLLCELIWRTGRSVQKPPGRGRQPSVGHRHCMVEDRLHPGRCLTVIALSWPGHHHDQTSQCQSAQCTRPPAWVSHYRHPLLLRTSNYQVTRSTVWVRFTQTPSSPARKGSRTVEERGQDAPQQEVARPTGPRSPLAVGAHRHRLPTNSRGIRHRPAARRRAPGHRPAGERRHHQSFSRPSARRQQCTPAPWPAPVVGEHRQARLIGVHHSACTSVAPAGRKSRRAPKTHGRNMFSICIPTP